MASSEIDNLKQNLQFDLISSSKNDLSSFERLYVLHQLTIPDVVNQRWLVDLYMKCGCFYEAMAVYERLEHWRKLGDLAWIQGRLSDAEVYYLKEETRNGEVFRGGKDWDRLIKLNFCKANWQSIIEIILQANISPLNEHQIVLGSSAVSSKPYVKIAAIAVSKTNITQDTSLRDALLRAFSIDKQEWSRLLNVAANISDEDLIALQTKSVPRITHTPHIGLTEALKKGSTKRADLIIAMVADLKGTLLQSQKAVISFFKTKNVSELSPFFGILSSLYEESMCKTFIMSVVSHVYQLFDDDQYTNLIVCFYESHPLLKRMYFGELLLLKFTKGIPITPSDIYTGLLQQVMSIETAIASLQKKSSKKDMLLDFDRLISFSDWIELKIESWIDSYGKKLLETTISTWNDAKAAKISGPFNSGKHYPQNPREMLEWKSLLTKLLEWLSDSWYREIGLEKWISERALFDIIRKRFKSYEVVRHAQPIWLEPQHLDIYIPALSIAVEYMGEQHYRPIDLFGGTTGYEATVFRDKRKEQLCRDVGIDLIYIRFDDEIGSKVEELAKRYLTKKSDTPSTSS